MMSCLYCGVQSQQFGGMDVVNGAEIGACGNKNISEDGNFKSCCNLYSVLLVVLMYL